MSSLAVVGNAWETEFKPLLGKTKRWEGFSLIVEDLLARPKPVIIETGTLREPGNWAGDGQSTLVWQWVMERKPGLAISVDWDTEASKRASEMCPNVHVVAQDSISFLRGFLPYSIDLLYLDSMENPMHQMGELAAIWDRLPSGCLIASDDSPTKGVLTAAVLKGIGVPCLLESYISVWQKP